MPAQYTREEWGVTSTFNLRTFSSRNELDCTYCCQSEGKHTKSGISVMVNTKYNFHEYFSFLQFTN